MRNKINLLLCCLCASIQSFAQTNQETFPYPSVPATLKTNEARADYVMAHYWDNFNFPDTLLLHKPDITEQGFVNFLDLLPRLDSLTAQKGVKAFCHKAYDTDYADPKVKKTVQKYFLDLTERYLDDPRSPMRNDVVYRIFLNQYLSSPSFDEANKIRYKFLFENVGKNLPGTTATDFAYIDRKGQHRTLHTTPGEYTVLYFNDPDCENCHAITAHLRKDSLLTHSPRIQVLAVYADADTEEWKKHPQPFPASWIDGYSPKGEITHKLLYFIRATPTIYLLDKHKKVLLKDPSPELLLTTLRQLTQTEVKTQ